MCKITKSKRTISIPTLDELQKDIHTETLNHMVNNLIIKSRNMPTARDFDSYDSDEEEIIVNKVLNEIVDIITEN